MAILNASKGLMNWMKKQGVITNIRLNFIFDQYKETTGNDLPSGFHYANQVYGGRDKSYKDNEKKFHQFASWYSQKKSQLAESYLNHRKQIRAEAIYQLNVYNSDFIQYVMNNYDKGPERLKKEGPYKNNDLYTIGLFKKVKKLLKLSSRHGKFPELTKIPE